MTYMILGNISETLIGILYSIYWKKPENKGEMLLSFYGIS